jgi:hypothetical protein
MVELAKAAADGGDHMIAARHAGPISLHRCESAECVSRNS